MGGSSSYALVKVRRQPWYHTMVVRPLWYHGSDGCGLKTTHPAHYQGYQAIGLQVPGEKKGEGELNGKRGRKE